MKKFFMIVVLLCATTLISSAEAIKDKDFEDFFNNMVKDIKSGNSIVSNFIDWNYIAKQTCKNSGLDISPIYYNSIKFEKVFDDNFSSIEKLNIRNNYHYIVINKLDFEINLIEPDPYYKELYGSDKIYKLSLMTGSEENFNSISCFFIKFKDEWEQYNWIIVDFEWTDGPAG